MFDPPTQALRHHPDVSPADRLGVTVVFAVLAHLILILGVTFVREERPERRVETLDVVLVASRSEVAPDQPDYLAQVNRHGGGESIEEPRPETPPPAPPTAGESAVADAVAAVVPERPDAEDPATPARSLVPTELVPSTASAASTALAPSTASALVDVPLQGSSRDTTMATSPAATTPSPSTHALGVASPVRRSEAIADLSAELERKLRAYGGQPRRRWISARTREHELAVYMDAWRRRVEHVGNLHFPDEAARRGLSGRLLLEVAILPDGTVEDIALRRSSGQPILDDAAVRIVRLAAPFARFPDGIAAEVDVLHVERTWIFHSVRGLSSP